MTVPAHDAIARPAIDLRSASDVAIAENYLTRHNVPAGALVRDDAPRLIVLDGSPAEVHDRRPWSINYGAKTTFEADGSVRIEGANHPALRMEQIRAVARAEGVRIARAGLHHIRVQLGETTDEHETYQPRHAKPQEPQP